MERQELIYELGRWSEAYFAKRSSEITSFFCWKCKREFHGVSMYEHFGTCCPKYFKRLSRPEDKKLRQEYLDRDLFGNVIKKTRKVEVDHVEQRGRGGFDPDGISPVLPGEVLQAEPREDIGAFIEDSWGENVPKEPESISKEIGRFQDDRKNQKDI